MPPSACASGDSCSTGSCELPPPSAPPGPSLPHRWATATAWLCPLDAMGALLPCPAARRSCALLSSAFVASSYDIGSINASADGVHIHTVLQLAKDEAGRLKISNITCNASIARMHAGFSGTLRYTQPHHSSPVLCRASSACAQLPDPLSAPLGLPHPRLCAHMGMEGQGWSHRGRQAAAELLLCPAGRSTSS